MQDSVLINEEIDDHAKDHEIAQEEKQNPPVLPKKTQKRAVQFHELNFVRIFDPIHIPAYLIEQIKDRNFDADKFYSYQKMFCLLQTAEGPKFNPTNLLYVLINERLRQVKGVLWMVVDLLNNSLNINLFSVDREYWQRGDAVRLTTAHSKKVMKDLSLKRIVWVSKNPRFFEATGFKRSKDAVMIYEG